MARHRAHREDEPREDRDAAGAPGTPPSPATAVLALQRAAGNAAVGGWLRASAPLVQRDHKVPDDASKLADVGDAVKAIQIDDARIGERGRAGLFKRDQLPARPGVKVRTHFGGDMAADRKDEQAVRNGLGSMAMIRFGLDGDVPLKKGEKPFWEAPKDDTAAQRRPPTADLVREEDLSLSDYGGKDARYRFTAVATKGTAASPTEVDLIVELIGAQRARFKNWGELSADRRTALQKTFDGYGFVKREPSSGSLLDENSEPIDDWNNDKWAWVLQAIELLPAATLGTLSGIAWQRGHPVPGRDKEDGFYETNVGMPAGATPTRRLTLYDKAFSSEDRLLATVAHEVGHALGGKPAEHAGGTPLHQDPGYLAAARADGVAITKYGATAPAEAYADAYSMFIAEPGTMKQLRPKTFEWFARQQAGFAKPAPKR